MEKNSNEKDTFNYTYSAKQQNEIQQIRSKYVTKPTAEPDKMEQLRRLDESVTKKATMISIIVGVIGTLLLGIGMSITMTDFGSIAGDKAMPVGIALGVVGIAVLGVAYPIYNSIIKKERAKIAPEILRITDELMK